MATDKRDDSQRRDAVASRREMLLAAGLVPAAMLIPADFAAAEARGPSGGAPPFVPVPERAKPPQFPSKGYLLDDLGGGLYGVRYLENYQSMFLVTRSGVVVIDAPAGSGGKVLAAIGEVTDKPVTHFVYSHAHKDHTGGAHLFPGKVQYVAHQLTAERLRRAGDPNRPVPTRTFAGHRHQLVVGGERLVLDYRGDNHLPGNLFIYAPEQQVLTLIDVVTPRWAPFFRLGLSSNVTAYTDAAEQILRYDFATLISGHAGHFGTRADVETHGRYLADLRAATGEALATVDPGDAVKDVPGDNYQAQGKAYNDAVVRRAGELMPRHWLSELGGADVFLPDNSRAVLWNIFID